MRKIAYLIILMMMYANAGRAAEKMYWLPADCSQNRQQLFSYFKQAALLGLEQRDYAFALVQQLQSGYMPTDSLMTDRALTQAAIAFFTDVAYGPAITRIGYDGLKYVPDCLDIPTLLYSALANNNFNKLLEKVEPSAPQYNALKSMIAFYNDRLQRQDYHPVKITSETADSSNHPLIDKLYQLGFLDAPDYTAHEDTLRIKIRAAEYMFEFLEDGALRQGVIEELNVSLEKRLSELKHAINTFRWLNCLRKYQYVVVVDIPAAELFVYLGDSTMLNSRVIVGKAKTPSSPLASRIDEVILFPYWTVPHNIAVKELLPGIKGAPSIYLEAGNYQVLDKSGRILDPQSINWNTLNKHNFPYTLRQMFGCDNSLGIIKLNFFNPYSTYLHDTPARSYFMFNSRYFSHGCIRVEDAIPLAKLLVPAEAPRIDSLSRMKTPPAGSPITIPMKPGIPVIILYEVAWPDANGKVRFFEDVYEKFK
ncbi:ErfK/YbiS/YcfS/YnhG family protein [Chitinophaga pinensis DSM 2588]|uniref:ErfK/YbiS/YcfS/YnhG family protein n=2 Tax=Chitinophaga pinensis TaxID=79329 RepID=A0A979G7Z9_CHIPD|nr:ErfK/YbiS/YcfS/YnhG family protein [Chitinophaga pinensis DSM 2588]